MNSRRVLVLFAALTCAGCRRDMQRQPKYLAFERSEFFPDGRTMRPIPPDTIAVDEVQYSSALDDGTTQGSFATQIPVPVTVDLMKRGQDRFDIYCAPCHGLTGNGYGTIASRGFKYPADLRSDRVRNAPPGYIYRVITNGYGAMDKYGYEVHDVRDRWAIVAYIRALELSNHATIGDVPPSERTRLEGGQ